MLGKTVTLSNGVIMPSPGYGTWRITDEQAGEAVKTAIEAGYRHIDTAYIYGNEKGVGEGIKAGLESTGLKREDLFVTTKLWVTESSYEKAIAACENSLKDLKLDYADLYLIHWPFVECISDNWEEINSEMWRGLEKLYKDGKVRAIGLSNFLERHILAINKNAAVLPMVSQIEYHPGYIQKKDTEWCQKNGMQVEGWRPFGNAELLGDELLNKLADKYGKTVAQICLRFMLQNDVVPLAKSLHKDRMISNQQVFDFEISEEDMKAIEAMPVTAYGGEHPDDGPVFSKI